MKRYGKIALIVGIGLCLYSAYLRLERFVLNYIPAGKPGECLSLSYPENKVTVKVSHNDPKTRMTDVLTPLDKNMYIYDRYSYADLRDLKAKVVQCE